MPSGMTPHGSRKKSNGRSLHGRLSMKLPRARKEKARGLSPRASLKERKGTPRSITPRPSQSQPSRSDRPQPKAKPEARSCMTSDFFFAMMSTKSKPTRRHSNWNGTDYVICTVAEPQRKLPVFKPGKWSLLPDSRISLYGHDAKSMKNFTLHFDMAEQCESLDRSWFGEMGFPVAKYVYQDQSSVSYDSTPDPADLDLEHGYSEPELCFSKSQVRDPACALLDSGATHVLDSLFKEVTVVKGVLEGRALVDKSHSTKFWRVLRSSEKIELCPLLVAL